MSDSILIVIPARLASTRLPEKLLRRVDGKSVLQHTWEAASRATVAEQIVVAVDDPKLADEVQGFGGRFVMTSVDCASGTDRIAEVAAEFPDFSVFVNVQGDEPEIDPAAIDLVGSTLIKNPTADMATVGTPIREQRSLDDAGCVKIVLASGKALASGNRERWPGQGRAIYFSRSAVPHLRGGVTPESLAAEPPLFWHHLGLYAYRRDFLQWFSRQPPGVLEQAERLEQLRAIEAGKQIVVARVESAVPGIDTEEDLDAFAARSASAKKTT
ncbi:3-deoxy-manno-octulosonate cytidylyltransferase [Novipirellula artificiosorum]|uniref:3-deoxy-manno-octulosonate cytidylyltransferase n=1 Tax=Novipirellula artificiosorum TaxID=2528016 RepID=A0A5C6DXD4_9BACT|nr:3-deoxy-manno-octulosonate cytidylyltransferase [Novipirellula artificiosorum]TWU42093.1 3-deoxy-manno-octulosonate cytidylyltransferase [Novipirellula artificiosorum]